MRCSFSRVRPLLAGVTFLIVGVVATLSVPAVASAATVVNGDFETGNFTGWTVVSVNAERTRNSIENPRLTGSPLMLVPDSSIPHHRTHDMSSCNKLIPMCEPAPTAFSEYPSGVVNRS